MHRLWASAGSGENSAGRARQTDERAAHTHALHEGIDNGEVLEAVGTSGAKNRSSSRKTDFDGEQMPGAALRTARGSSDGEHVIGQRWARRQQAGHGTPRISGRNRAAAAAMCLRLALTLAHVAGMHASLYCVIVGSCVYVYIGHIHNFVQAFQCVCIVYMRLKDEHTKRCWGLARGKF